MNSQANQTPIFLVAVAAICFAVTCGYLFGTTSRSPVRHKASFFVETPNLTRAYGIFTVDSKKLSGPLVSVLCDESCVSVETISYRENNEEYLACLSVGLEEKTSGSVSFEVVTPHQRIPCVWTISENDISIRRMNSAFDHPEVRIRTPAPPPSSNQP